MNHKFCPKCNSKTDINSKFCQKCGYAYENKDNSFSNEKNLINEPQFSKNEILEEFYTIVGENEFSEKYIKFLSKNGLNEIVGKNIKLKCIDLINNDLFTYKNIVNYDSISFEEYSYIINKVAYKVLESEKQFNMRSVYGYFGHEANQQTVLQMIIHNGTKYGKDPLINEFIECAIVDNKRLSFLPSSVTDKHGRKYSRKDYVNMANYVSKYEVDNGISPKMLFVSNKKFEDNQRLNPSFYEDDTINSIVLDKLLYFIASVSIQINDSIFKLNSLVGQNADGLIFKTKLSFNNLDQTPHGVSIRNRIEQEIYSLNITSDEIDNKLSEELENEINLKKDRLINKTYQIIGNTEIENSFLEKITPYNLNTADANKIRVDMINHINSNDFYESDYDEKLNNIVDYYKIERKHEILEKDLNDIINSPFFITEFKNKFILNKKGKIQENIIKNIEKNKISSDEEIKIKIKELMLYYEKKDVENELNNLDEFVIDKLLDDFSISSLLPFKKVKIIKLLDVVDVNQLKIKLSKYGVDKYNSEFNSDDDNFNEQKNDENSCPKCGFPVKDGVKFCTHCGTKL